MTFLEVEDNNMHYARQTKLTATTCMAESCKSTDSESDIQSVSYWHRIISRSYIVAYADGVTSVYKSGLC